MNRIRSRREVLGALSGWGAAMVLSGGALVRRAPGATTRPAPSNRLTVGIIGVGGKGSDHLRALKAMPEVQILAVADVYAPHRERAAEAAGPGCTAYRDYRELLAREDIDAVVIATPDHWHALMAVQACDAGKDVFCEKPLTLTIAETEAIIRAVRRNATIFQVGSQQRSFPQFRRAVRLVREGRIGKLQSIRTRVGQGEVCGWEPACKPPPELDWDMWLGPAPWAEYTPKRCLNTFRWFYDYSGGKLTDWGAHHNDIAQWVLGMDGSGPTRIEPLRAEFPTSGLFETAVRFHVRYVYPDGVTLDCTHDGNDVELHGSEGWIKVNRERIAASDPQILGPAPEATVVAPPLCPAHLRHWVECVRQRREPNAPVEAGASSAILCHLGNIALRTGRVIEWDPVQKRITCDENLNRWLSVPYRGLWHL